MSKVKAIACVLTTCIVTTISACAYTFDITVPVKGKSIASEQLQQDSLFTVYSFAIRAAQPNCQSFTIGDTKVSKTKQDGVWEEVWTLNACKNTIEVPISFTDKTYSIDPMKVKNIVSK